MCNLYFFALIFNEMRLVSTAEVPFYRLLFQLDLTSIFVMSLVNSMEILFGLSNKVLTLSMIERLEVTQKSLFDVVVILCLCKELFVLFEQFVTVQSVFGLFLQAARYKVSEILRPKCFMLIQSWWV